MSGRKIKRILLAESSDVMPMALESFGVSDTDVPMLGISAIGDVCLLVPCTSLEAAELLYVRLVLLVSMTWLSSGARWARSWR